MDGIGFGFGIFGGVVSYGAVLSGAMAMLSGETQGLALDFTDDDFYATQGFYGSAAIKDTGTPANNYDSAPDAAASSLLTYTSPSVKMTMGPSGTLRFGAHNLCLQSETFDNAYWTKSGVTVSANTIIAPGGSLAADSLVEDSATSSHLVISQTIATVVGASYTYSVRVKAAGRTFVYMDDANTLGCAFDLTNVTVAGTLGAAVGSITDLGDGWRLCSVAITSTLSTHSLRVFSTTDGTLGGLTYAGNGTTSIYLFGAHVRRTPSDSTYLATTSAARYALPFEWSTAGVLQGIRVEEARTNLCLYSDDLTNAAWTKSNMTTAKTATGPDGVANSATTCTATAGNATALQAITSGSAARIANMYIKRRTGSGTINITQDNGTTWTAVTVTSSWTRVESTVQTLTNPTVGIRIVTSGDAVDVALFGAEVGSFSTSPIPTIGSTVTRAADNISLATSVFPYDATQGTWLGVGELTSTPTANSFLQVFSSTNDRYLFRVDGLTSPTYYMSTLANSNNVQLDLGTVTLNTTIKAAITYAANDAAGCLNGGTVQTDTVIDIPTVTTLYVGSRNSGFESMNGIIKQIAYFPTRKSNAELQVITGA